MDKLAVAAHGDSVIALFECRVSIFRVESYRSQLDLLNLPMVVFSC
jgi:hypothetical protein